MLFIIKKIFIYIKLFFFLIKKHKLYSYFIKFNKNIGPEKLEIEHKRFTLNLIGIPFDNKELESFCLSNTIFPNFNDYIIQSLYKYIDIFLIKNVCGFLNSHIIGELFIGVDDFGNVKGIPFLGKFPKDFFYRYIVKELYLKTNSSELISTIIEKINISFLNVSKLPVINQHNNIHPNMKEYLLDQYKYKEVLLKYTKKFNKWKSEKAIWTKAIILLVNCKNTRTIINKYVEHNNPNNKNMIKLFKSNFVFKDKSHLELLKIRGNKNNPYHWIMECKDFMCKEIDKKRPPKPIELIKSPFIKSSSHPRHLINNLELISYWKKNYDINLIVIKISIKENINKAIYSYKGMIHERCINENKEPYVKNKKI